MAQLESDPALAPLAPAEIARARDAIAALRISTNDRTRAHLAYVAGQRVEIARAASETVNEERKLAQLEREHDRILLEASRRDAEQARLESEKLRVQNLARTEEAERARADAEQAMLLQGQSAHDAEAARAHAVQSQRVAEAQAQEASLSKREAELAIAAAESIRLQMQNLSARQEGRGRVMTLGEAAFAPGQAALQGEALANLNRVVEFVNLDPGKRIRIEGHTDNQGSANLNQVLSQRRAEALRDALVAKGVAGARIIAVGMGEDAPIASNETPGGRAKNRRVDVVLEPD